MSELPSFDPYEVLGVEKTADVASIKKAYKKLALLKHPDKCADESLRSARTDEFQRLNEAYAILGDDDKRRRHDALVTLDALHKQKARMTAETRPFKRASTFHSGFPTTGSTAYTSRGATNVEDRAPRRASDDDDFVRLPRRSTDYDFSRRSAPPPARERTKSEKDAAERRRNERLRDNGIRSARTSKYDYGSSKHDHDYRTEDDTRSRAKETRAAEPADPLRRKYTDQEDTLYEYTSLRSRAPRPSTSRRSSARNTPPAQIRRSSAPKESSKSNRESDEREILGRERQRREKGEKSEKSEKDDKARRKERERRERDRDDDFEPVSPRQRRTENVEPFDQRPPSLQHAKTSPPYGLDHIREPVSRTNTEPLGAKHGIPTMTRSKTMPVQASNTSSKRVPAPSKLRRSVRQDDYTSDSSSSGSDLELRRSRAKPVKYSYAKVDEPVVVEERYARQTRTVSPEPARHSAGAIRMANLARPAAASRSNSGYSLPLRTARSPERDPQRSREGSRSKPLFGELSPESPRRSSLGNVQYSKPIRPQDIIYAQRPATGRRERERDSYEDFNRPEMHRQPSYPIHTMS